MKDLLIKAKEILRAEAIDEVVGICYCLDLAAADMPDPDQADDEADRLQTLIVQSLQRHPNAVPGSANCWYDQLYPTASCEQIRAGRLAWLDRMVEWCTTTGYDSTFPPPPNAMEFSV